MSDWAKYIGGFIGALDQNTTHARTMMHANFGRAGTEA
jgi:hypothetical protein